MRDSDAMGCDTLVALAPATRAGVTLFGKNSDRPPDECQRLVQAPRRRSAPGGMLRCQYVEIPDVPETAAVLGSQPHWLWGFEHGVNEHRVAIGNETVFAKEPLGASGLLGMDLVRLGLERGRTATESLEVMTALLERHGQGGSGQLGIDWPYHNAFLIADPAAAWILETSDRHWVARPVDDVGNVSNGLAMGREWTRGHADVTAFAVAQGWWPADAGAVDFTRAYGDETGVPGNLCRARRGRLASLLAESRGQVTPAAVRGMLRDHYESGPLHVPRPFEHPQHFSVCMHSPALSYTTAALVAELGCDDRPRAAWACLGSPCMGAFLPIYLEGRVPARLSLGGAHADASSPWWRLHALRELVERDVARRAPVVRARFDALEESFAREAAAVEEEAAAGRRGGAPAAAAAPLTACMERAVTALVSTADELLAELS